MTQTLAIELAPNIRVNAVAPGPVATEAYLEVLGVSDELDKIVADIPSVEWVRRWTLPRLSRS